MKSLSSLQIDNIKFIRTILLFLFSLRLVSQNRSCVFISGTKKEIVKIHHGEKKENIHYENLKVIVVNMSFVQVVSNSHLNPLQSWTRDCLEECSKLRKLNNYRDILLNLILTNIQLVRIVSNSPFKSFIVLDKDVSTRMLGLQE